MNLRHGLLSTAVLIAPLALHAAVPAPASAPPATSAASPASAAPSKSMTSTLPQPPVPTFAQADANHDGKISWQEAKALGVPEKLFKQDDFDNSGDLNETEWMFVRLDMTDFTPASGTTAAPTPTSGK